MVECTIDVVDRGRMEIDLNFPLEAFATATCSEPDRELARGEGRVYNLVIDHPEGTVLWDTGSHPEASEGYWPETVYETYTHLDAADHPLEDDLDAAGWDVADIDYVVQTHLHLDHAGGLYAFEGTNVPVFVHRRELEHAYLSAKSDAGTAAYVGTDFDRNGNWRVIRGERVSYFEDVEFVHLPGHTPGVMGLLVHLPGGTLLFTSDQAYVEYNYAEKHPLGARLLWSRPDWTESLHRLKDLQRRHDAEVVYGHDPVQFEEIRDGW